MHIKQNILFFINIPMPSKSKTSAQRLMLLPGKTYFATNQHVKISKVPSLLPIIDSFKEQTEGVFIPLCGGPLIASENPDGTYSLLNDTNMFAPELSRMNPAHAEIWVLAPDQDLQPLRLHLAFVTPSRFSRTLAMFKDIFRSGAIAPLAKLYRADRHANTYAGAVALIPTMARSTYNEKKKNDLESSDKSEPKVTERKRTGTKNALKEKSESSKKAPVPTIERSKPKQARGKKNQPPVPEE